MLDENGHRTCVNAWMRRAAAGLPPPRLVQAFDQGFAALWRRAHLTLGDVTLTAIVGRVLYVAAEEHPFLSALTVDPGGLRCQELHERAVDLPPDRLAEALRFVLVEFLTVLGSLTAEILTPALHAELASIAPAAPGPAAEAAPGGSPNPESDGEEGEP